MKYLIIFTVGVVIGALIGNIQPVLSFCIGAFFGLGIGYTGSIFHMICSKTILEEDIDND